MTRFLLLPLAPVLFAGLCSAAPGGFLGAEVPPSGTPQVGRVVSGSPADKAGLEPGDLVLALDGRRVRSARDLGDLLGRAYPQAPFLFRVRRRGREVALRPGTYSDWSSHWRANPSKPRVGSAIVVAGRRIEIGAPVVTWRHPGGHDGYAHRKAFSAGALPSRPAGGCNTPERYAPRRNLSPAVAQVAADRGALTYDLAAAQIDQVVLHYDVAWTSQNCFKVLHDIRGLSCQFLLDVDGTLYQTLDVAERARHAGGANDRSVGVEIAHPGPLELTKNLQSRYTRDAQGVRFDLGRLAGTVRTPDFVVRPARPEPVKAVVQGRTYSMYDYTPAQYRTLTRLIAGLRRALPRIKLAVPRAPDQTVVTKVLPKESLQAWSGLLGHYHVSVHKQDPGPAFDWEKLLSDVRALEARKR
jgi:N-acetylmuramoyl-L-alanine amidase